MSRRERWAAADAAIAELPWGIYQQPEARQSTTPRAMAQAAFARGDRLFQIDLPVAVVQGSVGVGSTQSRTWRPEDGDVLGAIESAGWLLEHVSSTFVTHGSTATKRLLANGGSTEVATHGSLVGLYVFRRRAQPS